MRAGKHLRACSINDNIVPPVPLPKSVEALKHRHWLSYGIADMIRPDVKNVMVLGTNHAEHVCATLVAQTVRATNPDTIAVEFDEGKARDHKEHMKIVRPLLKLLSERAMTQEQLLMYKQQNMAWYREAARQLREIGATQSAAELECYGFTGGMEFLMGMYLANKCGKRILYTDAEEDYRVAYTVTVLRGYERAAPEENQQYARHLHMHLNSIESHKARDRALGRQLPSDAVQAFWDLSLRQLHELAETELSTWVQAVHEQLAAVNRSKLLELYAPDRRTAELKAQRVMAQVHALTEYYRLQSPGMLQQWLLSPGQLVQAQEHGRPKMAQLMLRRDEHMARKIVSEGQGKVLAIVGFAHVPGLFHQLRQLRDESRRRRQGSLTMHSGSSHSQFMWSSESKYFKPPK